MINIILNIVTSLAATFIYSLISKYFLLNEKQQKETDNIVKITNMIVSLLIYISTLIFLFILSPVLTGQWKNITDVGMFNVIKASLGPLMIISISAISLAGVSIIAVTIGKTLNIIRKNQQEAITLVKNFELKNDEDKH